jgi:hypothetical protein
MRASMFCRLVSDVTTVFVAPLLARFRRPRTAVLVVLHAACSHTQACPCAAAVGAPCRRVCRPVRAGGLRGGGARSAVRARVRVGRARTRVWRGGPGGAGAGRQPDAAGAVGPCAGAPPAPAFPGAAALGAWVRGGRGPACPAPLPGAPGAVRRPPGEASHCPADALATPGALQAAGEPIPGSWACPVCYPRGMRAVGSARALAFKARRSPGQSTLMRSLGWGCLQVTRTPCGVACAGVRGNASASADVLGPHGSAPGAAPGRLAAGAGPCLGEGATLAMSLEAPLHARHAAPQPAAGGRGWLALAGEPVVYALPAPRVLLRCMLAQAQGRHAAVGAPAPAAAGMPGMPGRCQNGLGTGGWDGGAGAAGDSGESGSGDGRWQTVGGACGAGGAAQASWQVPAGNAADAAFAAATTAVAFGLASALIVRAACMHSVCGR